MGDGGLSEANRRLVGPIYEALENNNTRLAMQLCNKQLKKHPDSLIVKALKALTLEEDGKTSEAMALAREVDERKPTDIATLQALAFMYKALAKYDQLLQAYDHAYEQQPADEGLGHHVFTSAVRINAFLKQQQTANRLYKTHGTDKYLFWAICSLLLQAQDANRAKLSSTSLQLTLADKMMHKAVEEKRVQSLEEFQLFLHILAEKGDADGVAHALQGDLGKSIFKVEQDRLRLLLQHLLKQQRWGDSLAVARELLTTHSADDWIVLSGYLDAWFALHSAPAADETAATEAFLGGLVPDSSRDGGVAPNKAQRDSRGPRLVLLEFHRRLHAGDRAAQQVALYPLIEAYAHTFSTKFMCFADLRPYLECLDGAAASRLIDAVVHGISEENTIANTRKLVFVEQLRRLFRPADTPAAARADVARALLNRYHTALKLGVELASSERQHGDDFVLLAVHELLDAYYTSGDLGLVTSSLVFLEGAVERSRANFQLRLLAVRLYTLIGAVACALPHYRYLSIKHIQHDTLSYFVTDHLVSLGAFERTAELCEHVLDFYRTSNREVAEMTVLAYDQQTYSKIREFIDFRARLEASLHRVYAALEFHVRPGHTHDVVLTGGAQRLSAVAPAAQGLEDLVKEFARAPPQLEPLLAKDFDDAAFWACRRDNRDYGVVVSWNRSDRATVDAELRARLPGQRSVDWARRQIDLLRVVAFAASKDAEALTGACDALERTSGAAATATAAALLGKAVAATLAAPGETAALEVLGRARDILREHVAHNKQAQLQRYTKARSKEERFLAPGFITDLVAALESVGVLLPLAIALNAVLPLRKGKKDKSAAGTALVDTAKCLGEVCDVLRDAASDVRTLAQAAQRDLAEEFERRPDELAQAFAALAVSTSDTPRRIGVVQDALKSVRQSLAAVAKEAERKSVWAKALKAAVVG